MTRKMAEKKARETYGPTATAVQVSSKDRNQRFGVSMVEPGGLDRAPILVVLGFGDSYEAAFKMAETNPAATMAENRMKTIKEVYERGGFNSPEEYTKLLMAELAAQYEKEKNNGTEHQGV